MNSKDPMNPETRYVDFKVMIPNLEGDAIAETVTVQAPVTICPHSGDEMLTVEAFEIIDTTKARYMGLLLPAEIGKLRQRHGLTQRQMSDLLQVGEKSYTRWETGWSRPSRVINVLLRALDEGKVTLEWLNSLQRRSFSWSKVIAHDFNQTRSQQPAVRFTWSDEPSLPACPENNHETVPAAA